MSSTRSPQSALILLVMLSASCSVSTRLVPTNPPLRGMQPRKPRTVDVYVSSLPTRRFVEVGLLQQVGHGRGWRNWDHYTAEDLPYFIQAARAEAAQFGCDAVVINSGGSESRATFWGACLVYSDTGADAIPARAPAASFAAQPARR